MRTVAEHTAGVPVVLYNHTDLRPTEHDDSLWKRLLAPLRNRDDMKESFKRLDHIERHIDYQSHGRSSGVHGLFHQ
jgi:GPI-anchor transamidase subunit GAA1